MRGDIDRNRREKSNRESLAPAQATAPKQCKRGRTTELLGLRSAIELKLEELRNEAEWAEENK